MRKLLIETMCCMASLSAMSQSFSVNGVTFDMVEVKGGTFLMGAQRTDATKPNYDADLSEYFIDTEPVHSVELSSFHMATTEVTQQLWRTVMGEELLKTDQGIGVGDDYPAYYLSFENCMEFIYTINDLLQDEIGNAYFYIPTEAQWEYAARGGVFSSDKLFSGSSTITDVAWYNGNSNDVLHPVAQLTPNALGIYDMSGNVQEWCLDYYVNSYDDFPSVKDPCVTDYNQYTVTRGGHFGSYPKSVKVHSRNYQTSEMSNSYSGLRLVLIGYKPQPNSTGKHQADKPANNNIYTLDGVMIKSNASKKDLNALPKGVYIINNKLIVK